LSTEELRFSLEVELHSTSQEDLVRERENPSEDASVDQIFQSLPLRFLSREKMTLKDLLMPKDQEDSVQRELTTLDTLSCSERRMTLESTLLEEKSKEVIRPSIKPQRFKDLSLKRESEERLSPRDQRLRTPKTLNNHTLLTKSSSPSTSRRRKLPRKPLKHQLPQLPPKLPQLKPLQPRPLPQKLPLKLPQPKLLPQQKRKLPVKRERSEAVLRLIPFLPSEHRCLVHFGSK